MEREVNPVWRKYENGLITWTKNCKTKGIDYKNTNKNIMKRFFANFAMCEMKGIGSRNKLAFGWIENYKTEYKIVTLKFLSRRSLDSQASFQSDVLETSNTRPLIDV